MRRHALTALTLSCALSSHASALSRPPSGESGRQGAGPTLVSADLLPDGRTIRLTWSEPVTLSPGADNPIARPGGRPAAAALATSLADPTTTLSTLAAGNSIAYDEDCLIDIPATMVTSLQRGEPNAAIPSAIAFNASTFVLLRPPLHEDLAPWAEAVRTGPAVVMSLGDSTMTIDADNRIPDGAKAEWRIRQVSGWLSQTAATSQSALGVGQFFTGAALDLSARILTPDPLGFFQTFTTGSPAGPRINIAARTYGELRFLSDAPRGIGLFKATLQGGSASFPVNKFNDFYSGSWRDGAMSIDLLVWHDNRFSLRAIDIFANRTPQGAPFNLYGTITQARTHTFDAAAAPGIQRVTLQCNGAGEPSFFVASADNTVESPYAAAAQQPNCVFAPLAVRFRRTDVVGTELGFFGFSGGTARDWANESLITDTALVELFKHWPVTHILIDLGKNLEPSEFDGATILPALRENIVASALRIRGAAIAAGLPEPSFCLRAHHPLGENNAAGVERTYMRQVEWATYQAKIELQSLLGRPVAFANLMRAQRFQPAKAAGWYPGGTDWVHQSSAGARGFERAFWSLCQRAMCPGDVNADGAINFADLTAVLDSYGVAYTFEDLSRVLGAYGAVCP